MFWEFHPIGHKQQQHFYRGCSDSLSATGDRDIHNRTHYGQSGWGMHRELVCDLSVADRFLKS